MGGVVEEEKGGVDGVGEVREPVFEGLEVAAEVGGEDDEKGGLGAVVGALGEGLIERDGALMEGGEDGEGGGEDEGGSGPKEGDGGQDVVEGGAAEQDGVGGEEVLGHQVEEVPGGDFQVEARWGGGGTGLRGRGETVSGPCAGGGGVREGLLPPLVGGLQGLEVLGLCVGHLLVGVWVSGGLLGLCVEERLLVGR